MRNPNAFWPIDYEQPFAQPITGPASTLNLAKVFQLRAAAHLGNAEPDLAENDFISSIRLDEPLTRNCFLLQFLVGTATRKIDDGILWEGIHRHSWSNDQLGAMEEAIAQSHPLILAIKSLRFERAQAIQMNSDLERHDPGLLDALRMWRNWDQVLFVWLRPRGWWDEDKISTCVLFQRQIDAIDLTKGMLNRISLTSSYPGISGAFYTPLTRLSEGTLNGLGSNIAEAETDQRMARLACRLEEFYLAHKAYPENLAELGELPAHLNQEVLSENPLHYRRKSDSYILYSPGWDGKDRGGTPRQIGQSDNNYDWVWPGP